MWGYKIHTCALNDTCGAKPLNAVVFKSWKLNCGNGAEDDDVVVVVAAPEVVPCAAVVVAVVMVAVGTALVLSGTGGVGGIGTGPKAGGESSLGFLEPESLTGMNCSWS